MNDRREHPVTLMLWMGNGALDGWRAPGRALLTAALLLIAGCASTTQQYPQTRDGWAYEI